MILHPKVFQWLALGGLLLPALAIGQPEGFTDTGNKLFYTVHQEGGSDRKAKVGEIITVRMRYRTENDSVLFDSKSRGGTLRFQLPPAKYKGDINEGYALLGPGDSATFATSANQFYGRVLGKNRPKFIRNGSYLFFDVVLVKTETQAEVKAALAEERQRIRKEEDERIKQYLEAKNLTAQPTESGLYIISRSKGAGAMARQGREVRVHYTGTLLDGRKFDSSHDRGQPLPFTLGEGKVIKGWEEAVATMRTGDKITILCPSHLAYGKRGFPGSIIRPFATLIFDMELVEVR